MSPTEVILPPQQEITVRLLERGPAGPAGPQGPPGPAGPASGYPLAATYTYVDGRIATTLEDGVLTEYAYNPDGSIHSDTRTGVTRVYAYDTAGNLTGIAAV